MFGDIGKFTTLLSSQSTSYTSHREEVLKELGPRLGKFLKKYGYNSPEELDKMVKDTLKGPALSEYLQVSKE